MLSRGIEILSSDMDVSRVTARSILTPSGLPGADYVINPFVGCSHRCIYCYACFMTRFAGQNRPWGSFVDIKENASQLVPTAGDRYRGKHVFLSSVTDPYLPQEREATVTRRILERLVALEPRLSIQTKSDLILRDIDVLTRFRDCEAGLTITTLDDRVRQEIEPGAAPIVRRLAALAELKAKGMRTYVFVGPIMPGLTDWRRIIAETAPFADFWYFENLNVRGQIRSRIRAWLLARHPELLGLYGHAYTPGSPYWDEMASEIRNFCATRSLEARVVFHHGGISKDKK